MHNTARQRLVKADTNYGIVGDNTVRTASQIGNETGAADFGEGAVTSQTLRVALADGTSVGITPVNTGVNTYGELPSVATGSETVVVTYTATQEHFLLRANASGMANGRFSVKIDGNVVARKRIAWTKRNVDFDFGKNGIRVPTGSTIEITVLNSGTGPSPYDGNLYGEEI